jgi:Zn ribbon nucleic-acid-binding protein
MPKLSDEQKRKYLSSGGARCPYCGSEDIQGESVQIEEGAAVQEVSCIDCDSQWYDIYKLVNVEGVE